MTISRGTKLIDEMRENEVFTPEMREWLEQRWKLIHMLLEYKKHQ